MRVDVDKDPSNASDEEQFEEAHDRLDTTIREQRRGSIGASGEFERAQSLRPYCPAK